MEYLFNLEYQEIDEHCPPKDYLGTSITSYRWVFDTIENPLNFTPQYFKDPKRFNSKDDITKCIAMSLSLWNSEEASISRFNYLKSSFLGPRVYKVLGTNLAIGHLSKSDGVNSKVEDNGHFSHHQGESTDYPKIFKILKELK